MPQQMLVTGVSTKQRVENNFHVFVYAFLYHYTFLFFLNPRSREYYMCVELLEVFFAFSFCCSIRITFCINHNDQ